MGAKQARPELASNILELLKNKTHFEEKQILKLYSRSCDLDKNNDGFVTKEELLKIKQIQTNPLGDRIVETFIREANKYNHIGEEELSNQDVIRFPEFCAMLASFNRKHGVEIKEESMKHAEDHDRFCKMRFLFDMYDNDDDDRITETEMLNMLCKMATDPVTKHQRVEREELAPYN